MILAHEDLEGAIDFSGGKVNTLVIENQDYFCELLSDINSQINGFSGKFTLSENNKILAFPKNAELIDSILNFQINQKSLINKIITRLSEESVDSENYRRTMEILGDIQQYVETLSDSFPCELIESKLSFENIIKAVGVEIQADYKNKLEEIIDYMELVREFDRDKLFIFVSLRSYFSPEKIADFFDTIISHEFKVLLVDQLSNEALPNEKRLTIDADLCEI